MKAVLIQTSQDTMHMQYMGNVPWMLPRSTRLPEQLFCHPYGLMAVWYILRTKVEQLLSDFVNIYLADDVYYSFCNHVKHALSSCQNSDGTFRQGVDLISIFATIQSRFEPY